MYLLTRRANKRQKVAEVFSPLSSVALRHFVKNTNLLSHSFAWKILVMVSDSQRKLYPVKDNDLLPPFFYFWVPTTFCYTLPTRAWASAGCKQQQLSGAFTDCTLSAFCSCFTIKASEQSDSWFFFVCFNHSCWIILLTNELQLQIYHNSGEKNLQLIKPTEKCLRAAPRSVNTSTNTLLTFLCSWKDVTSYCCDKPLNLLCHKVDYKTYTGCVTCIQVVLTLF